MTLLSRLLRVLVPVVLLLPVPALAQEYCTLGIASNADVPEYARPDDPWIYRGTDIPVDQQWLFGEMPNGLRYAVRQNGVPPCQVSIRVRIDAGSLHEEEGERGYAHLLEHLLFRESRYFGPGEAIPFFQRMGAALGLDTNASTSPTQTVYQLDLPNASRERLDDSFRLLSGMIQDPALTAENIASDLPIVLAERRERLGPDLRIAMAMRELFYTGQRLADRAPIGTVEDLQAATPESVRAFHQRWYRPENTVVVMVGDAAPHVLAAMVERHFADWQVDGPVVPQPDFGAPQMPEGADPANPVGEAAVVVEPGQPLAMTYTVLRPWVQVVDNLEYNRGLLIDSIAQAIINRRLEENARAGANYLYAVVQQDDVSRSADATFVNFAPLNDDWQSALGDVRSVIADAIAHPPSEAEIERAVAQYDVIFQDMVGQERIQAGSTLADNLVNAVDIREAVAAPETFLSVFRNMRHRFTPEAIQDHTRRLFEGEVVRAILLTPELGEATADEVRRALLRPVVAGNGERNDGPQVDLADLPPIGPPAEPVSRGPLGIGMLSTTELITFPNGVRAMIRDSENEPGRVTVRVRFGAGWRGFEEDEAVYAQLGQRALIASGIGPLGQNELDRIAAGRKISFDFEIGEGVFTFEGITRAEDLGDQLYLLAAKLANPRWDVAPVERSKASALLAYDAYSGDPMGVLNRELDQLLRGGDPRFATPTPDEWRAANASTFRQVWSRLLAQGPVEVSVFGDIDPDMTVAALSRTFGALPEREPLPAEVADRAFPGPVPDPETVVLRHEGEADQAAALIAWPSSGGSAGLPQSRKLELLAQVFGNRILDRLRERDGSSYTPFATSNWPLDADTGGYILTLGMVQPGDVQTYFELADAIAQDLATNGPTPDELARVIEPVRQNIFRAQTGHTFWLNRMQGGTIDPLRLANLPSLGVDYIGTTPEEIRALAQRYLVSSSGLRIAVLPGN